MSLVGPRPHPKAGGGTPAASSASPRGAGGLRFNTPETTPSCTLPPWPPQRGTGILPAQAPNLGGGLGSPVSDAPHPTRRRKEALPSAGRIRTVGARVPLGPWVKRGELYPWDERAPSMTPALAAPPKSKAGDALLTRSRRPYELGPKRFGDQCTWTAEEIPQPTAPQAVAAPPGPRPLPPGSPTRSP